MAKYANVIVDITTGKLDHPFQYLIPPELTGKLKEGMQVRIPFGNGKEPRLGFIIELTDQCEFAPDKLKAIAGIDEEAIPVESQLITLASFIRDHFGGTMSQALKTVLPVKHKTNEKQERTVVLSTDREQVDWYLEQFRKKHAVARQRLLEALLETPSLPMGDITGKLNVSAGTVKALADLHLIRIETKRSYRNPLTGQHHQDYQIQLNEEQSQIVNQIMARQQQNQHGTYLIHGVTGSGKTEVYMALIEQVIQQGRQAILLIPEIALTFQTVSRFYRKFGEKVTILNSKMTPGERFDQMQRARKAEVSVCIGPRSALFTPFPNLGMILIDEEHESSYKSETVPRYHARETAIERARLAGADVVLGSATPSVDSYYKALKGEYQLFRMKKRYEDRKLPQVYTVDLREELKEGNRTIFSRKLQVLMEDRLQRQEQTMLFLNRRGALGFISCRACGHVMKCPHCDVSLTAHNNGKLVCHYCGYQTPYVSVCPECGSKYIGGFKAGTQKIEEAVKKLFPKARVLRMDADTAKSRDDYEKILQTFANQEADILVGTQMIVKGHDFPKVTLMGILAADLSLNASNFRAAERTFQLLTQAAGRAGRGERPGEVVIQTYHPEHYSVVTAASQDYEAFYQEEIGYRSLMNYPPVANMMVIHVFSSREERADDTIQAIHELVPVQKGLWVIGPADAPIGRIADIYHKVIYYKHQDYEELVQIKRELESHIRELMKNGDVNIQFDFNPMF